MNNYQDLLKQRESRQAELATLDQQIEDARLAELEGVLTQMRSLIETYKISKEQLYPNVESEDPPKRPSPMKGSKAVPRYRNPETGAM